MTGRRLVLCQLLLLWALCLNSIAVAANECPDALASGTVNEPRTLVTLYAQGRLTMKTPQWIMERGEYMSPEAALINRCSKRLRAETVTDSLPERLNVFAYVPETPRSGAFIGVSSVDQKMAMERTGPYWHAYATAFPDLRFVGATVRFAHGLVTSDEDMTSPADLAGRRVGLVMRPSSLRALQEIVLISAWDIYDQITVKEYLPNEMPKAMDRGEVDAMFMPVARVVNGELLPMALDINRSDIHWVSLSREDVAAATNNTPVLAERVVLTRGGNRAGGGEEVGLISFDVAWFTFAETPDDVVYEFAHAVQRVCPPRQTGCTGRSMETMLRWPALSRDLVHPGARRFYEESGVQWSP